MKKILLLLASPAIIFFASCGGSKTDDTTVAIPGMMEVQLKINGNALSIMVPDSTKGKLEMVEQSWGATEIKVGKEFQISIQEGEGELTDLIFQKSMISSEEPKKLKRYINDDSTLIFYEQQIETMDPEFHFYSIVKIGNVSYVVKDIPEEKYSEKAVQTMVEAAKTLKAKDAPKPEA